MRRETPAGVAFPSSVGWLGSGGRSQSGPRAGAVRERPAPGSPEGSLPLTLAPLCSRVWPGLPCGLRAPRGRGGSRETVVAAGAGPGSLLLSPLGQVRPRTGAELGSEGWWRVAGSRGMGANGMRGVVAALKHGVRQAGCRWSNTLGRNTHLSLL